jgi:hypothetical protein
MPLSARSLSAAPPTVRPIFRSRNSTPNPFVSSRGCTPTFSKSRAVLGRHTIGHAIDLVPVDAQGRVDFSDLDGFDRIMTAMKQAAEELSIPIEWGGNWKSLVDKPHFELNRRVYPGPSEKARPDEALVAFR